MRTLLVGMVAVAGLACGAMAGPCPKGGTVKKRQMLTRTTAGLMGPDANFSDNFDGYAAGSAISGQGGWEVWYTGGGDGSVSNTFASSAPNSLAITTNSDVVHRFTETDGQWVFKIKTYVPSSTPAGSGGYVILMNQYGGVDNWSVQIGFNDTVNGTTTVPFLVESQWDNATLPLVMDQWVEFRSEIDLDTDQVTNYYNNQMLGVPHLWTQNNFASGPGITSIACVDLYSPAISAFYFDDVALEEVGGCYPDCNADGFLTVADFGCFQTQFVAGNTYADCNGDGVLTAPDFGCFQTQFVVGCP